VVVQNEGWWFKRVVVIETERWWFKTGGVGSKRVV